MKKLLRFLPLLLVCAVAARADYKVVARFPIGGDTSSYDYLRVDPVSASSTSNFFSCAT